MDKERRSCVSVRGHTIGNTINGQRISGKRERPGRRDRGTRQQASIRRAVSSSSKQSGRCSERRGGRRAPAGVRSAAGRAPERRCLHSDLAERLPRHVRERLRFLLMRARALRRTKNPVKRLSNVRQQVSCSSAEATKYRARFRAEACPLQVCALSFRAFLECLSRVS